MEETRLTYALISSDGSITCIAIDPENTKSQEFLQTHTAVQIENPSTTELKTGDYYLNEQFYHYDEDSDEKIEYNSYLEYLPIKKKAIKLAIENLTSKTIKEVVIEEEE